MVSCYGAEEPDLSHLTDVVIFKRISGHTIHRVVCNACTRSFANATHVLQFSNMQRS